MCSFLFIRLRCTLEIVSNKRHNNHVINLIDQTDVLSNNIVDKDVQSMFLPFTQTILLSPKYRIKNNIISPNNLFNKRLLLCGTLICMSAYFFFINFSCLRILIDLHSSKVVICIVFYDFYYHVSEFLADFVINLVETKTSDLFILTIQAVHRCLNNEHSSTRYMKNSWITVSVIFFYYIVLCVCNYILNENFRVYLIVSLAALTHFGSNIVYAIRFIKLLRNKFF